MTQKHIADYSKSWCGVGFNFYQGTDVIDQISPDSELHQYYRPGDRVTRFRVPGAVFSDWVDTSMEGQLINQSQAYPRIKGSPGTMVELELQRFDGQREIVKVVRGMFAPYLNQDGKPIGIFATDQSPDLDCKQYLSDATEPPTHGLPHHATAKLVARG